MPLGTVSSAFQIFLAPLPLEPRRRRRAWLGGRPRLREGHWGWGWGASGAGSFYRAAGQRAASPHPHTQRGTLAHSLLLPRDARPCPSLGGAALPRAAPLGRSSTPARCKICIYLFRNAGATHPPLLFRRHPHRCILKAAPLPPQPPPRPALALALPGRILHFARTPRPPRKLAGRETPRFAVSLPGPPPPSLAELQAELPKVTFEPGKPVCNARLLESAGG